MQRTLMGFSCLLVLTVASAAQTPPPPTAAGKGGKQPRLVVEEKFKELGNVVHGDVIPLEWKLSNKGDADLVIEKTVASCGCTVLQMNEAERTIPAGGSLAVKGEFRSVNRKGEQLKNVIVHSNDPVEPQMELQFHARVDVLFEMNPPLRWVLRGIRRGQAATDTLDITPGENRLPIQVVDAQVKDPGLFTISSEALETQSGPGRRFRLSSSENAPLGHLTTAAVLKLKIGDREKDLEVPIHAEIVLDLMPQPKIIAPSSQESAAGRRLAPVVLRSLEKTPFDILEAKAGPVLDVKVEPVADKPSKTEYNLFLTIREDAPPGPFGAMLEIRTSSLSQPLIRVPVFDHVAPRIQFDPPIIVLRQDGTMLGSERRVKIESWAQTVLDITSVKCDHAAVAVTLSDQKGVAEDNVRYLQVRLAGKLPPGVHAAKVTLTTGIAGAEVVEIPVSIEFPG